MPAIQVFSDKDILVDFLRHKPQEMEVVLTGRNPAPELVELADYVLKSVSVNIPLKRYSCPYRYRKIKSRAGYQA
ncbi:MAG: cob(I)yrinic acid a,c-diamide adenosyltransferase [Phascolarctobacterium sp.]